jgi:hypothetical protein
MSEAIRDRVKELRRVRAGDLLANPKNWRLHPSAQRAALEGALREIGFAGALLARETPEGRLLLLDGHLRAEIDPELAVPVLVLDVSEAEGDTLLASFDPISAMAERNEEAFAQLVGDLTIGDTALRAMVLHLAAALPEGLRPPSLAERFLAPPFSVLDARQGYWQDRKRAWLALGLEPPLGAIGGEGNTAGPNSALNRLSGRLARERHSAAPLTSIFDPVLCEVILRWFSPAGARVLDPFAGGSVRGLVAGMLGRAYLGGDLRAEQLEANRAQWARACALQDEAAEPLALGLRAEPIWRHADARDLAVAPEARGADLLFSCPPYGDLEIYTDDPRDLSRLEYGAFIEAHRAIIARALAALAPDRFACWVVADFRDKGGCYRGFVAETIRAFAAAGAALYNDAVLIHPAGSLPLRAGVPFRASRKLGKTHENVLIFVKGDPRRAADACGPAEVALEPEGADGG